MAKTSERNQAKTLYIDQGLTAKEISERLRVSEKSLSEWVAKGNWRTLRDAKQSSSDNLVKNYNELLSLLIEKRLKFEKKVSKTDDEKAEHSNTIDEISKIAAAIDRIQKDGRPSLRTHIHCLDKFMSGLQFSDPKLFKALVPYQLTYLDLLAEELK